MNRRQKIIVSITGIFLILLMLMGLTYGYLLSIIKGNGSSQSIGIATANLSLKYNDGNGTLQTANFLMPGEKILFNILDEEGNVEVDSNNKPLVTEEKVFSVSNIGGDVDQYAIILDNFTVKYASDKILKNGESVKEGQFTYFSFPDDLKIDIKCESSIEGNSCNETSRALPTTNDILLTNSIKAGETQTYKLKLEYINTKVDQSEDMGKTFTGRLNIMDLTSTADIEGFVYNYESGDYVQINSETQISPIDKDGYYKLVNVEIGTHTLTLRNKNNEIKMSKSITIKKGKIAEINDTTITITETKRNIEINIRNSGIFIDNVKQYNSIEIQKDGIVSLTKFAVSKEFYESLDLTEEEKTNYTYNENGIYSYKDDTTQREYTYFRGAVDNNYFKLGTYTDSNGNIKDLLWRIIWYNNENKMKLVLDENVPITIESSSGAIFTLSKNDTMTNFNNYTFLNGESFSKDVVASNYRDRYITYTANKDNFFDNFINLSGQITDNNTFYKNELLKWYNKTDLENYSILIKVNNFCYNSCYSQDDNYKKYTPSNTFDCSYGYNVNTCGIQSSNYSSSVGFLTVGDVQRAGLAIKNSSKSLLTSNNYLINSDDRIILSDLKEYDFDKDTPNGYYFEYYSNYYYGSTGISADWISLKSRASVANGTWFEWISLKDNEDNYKFKDVQYTSKSGKYLYESYFLGNVLKPVIVLDIDGFKLNNKQGSKGNPYTIKDIKNKESL